MSQEQLLPQGAPVTPVHPQNSVGTPHPRVSGDVDVTAPTSAKSLQPPTHTHTFLNPPGDIRPSVLRTGARGTVGRPCGLVSSSQSRSRSLCIDAGAGFAGHGVWPEARGSCASHLCPGDLKSQVLLCPPHPPDWQSLCLDFQAGSSPSALGSPTQGGTNFSTGGFSETPVLPDPQDAVAGFERRRSHLAKDGFSDSA